MAISPKKRFKVLERDGFKCKYCGRDANTTVLEIDHIMPKSKGGKDIMDNLITSCHKCNRGKGNSEIGESETNYKAKIANKVYDLKCYFYDERNNNKMGMIDNKTKVLLNLYVDRYMKNDNWVNHVRYPVHEEMYGNKSHQEFCEFFLISQEYQDDVIEIMYKELKYDIDEIIMNVFDDSYWNWSCEEDYARKLNYYITESVVDDYIEMGKKYVLHKFTLFPNLLKDA